VATLVPFDFCVDENRSEALGIRLEAGERGLTAKRHRADKLLLMAFLLSKISG
jgi:hypothetical protein